MAPEQNAPALSPALRLVLSLSLVAVAVVAGVATLGPDAGSTGSAPTDGDTTVTSPVVTAPVPTPGPSDTIAPPRGTPIVPNPDAIEPNPVSFDTSQARASARGVVVPFYGGVSPCFVLASYDAQETGDQVVITLTGGRLPTDEPVACIELAQLYEVDIPLEAPLGDRTVVDGSATG